MFWLTTALIITEATIWTWRGRITADETIGLRSADCVVPTDARLSRVAPL